MIRNSSSNAEKPTINWLLDRDYQKHGSGLSNDREIGVPFVGWALLPVPDSDWQE
jgi:hypothetical protein